MAFNSEFYGDPMKVLERKQAQESYRRKPEGEDKPPVQRPRNCKDCVHKLRMFGLEYCALGNTKAGEMNMKPCYRFEAKK